MNVGSKLRWSTASATTSWHHFHSTFTQKCQSLTQFKQCNSVRVPLHAYIPHWKVLKHIIYVQYECQQQTKVVYSLDHDIVVSFPLNCHPDLPKSDPASVVQQCEGALICLHTSLKGAKKNLYVHHGCGKQSNAVYSLGSASTGWVPSEDISVTSSVTKTQKMWTLAAPLVRKWSFFQPNFTGIILRAIWVN